MDRGDFLVARSKHKYGLEMCRCGQRPRRHASPLLLLWPARQWHTSHSLPKIEPIHLHQNHTAASSPAPPIVIACTDRLGPYSPEANSAPSVVARTSGHPGQFLARRVSSLVCEMDQTSGDTLVNPV
jgi:hypothetical protein